jgi:hypothetical protein
MERGEAMHFKPKGVLGIAVPVLIGGALAAGALALPAHAQSYQDTAVSGTAVTDESFTGGTLEVGSGEGGVLALAATGGTSGVTWTLHSAPSGVTLSGGNTIVYSGSPQTGPFTVVADATDSAGNAKALVIPVSMGTNTIATDGTVGPAVSLNTLADTNVSGTITFSVDSNATNDTINFAESLLPSGLTSGNPTLTYVGGTAAPGTYTGVVVTATDADGAVLNGTFSLTVTANTVNNYGDEVNNFGNGFDSYRQHDYAGAIIAGWPATQSDPATHFLLNNGSHQGAYQFEYAPNGSGSGLCVSDPGGGWGSDPLRDGLILTPCNSGPFQQFIPQSDGTLMNLATGLIVNPDGKGAQLRGEGSAVSWGGSSYTWTGETSLP